MSEICNNLKHQLLESINSSSKVFIVGHNEPDFDSISSAIGIQNLCTAFDCESYIIVNDSEQELEPSVKKIIESSKNKYNIIKLSDFLTLIGDNCSLIVVDANKKYQLSVSEYLDLFKNIIVIDHHNPDQHTIASTYSYIEPNISSAAEIVARLLNYFKVPYTSDVSNYLLAGIELDTNRYKKNTTSITHDVAEKLIDKGANPDFVNRLFLAEFETDCRINNLVYNGSIFERYERSLFQYRQVSFTLNRAFPTTIYKKEDLAKAADKLLEYPVDASFVIGYVKDGLVSISARSKSDINVGEIMEEFTGGGNAQSAACKVETTDIKSLEEDLKRVVGTKISPKTESHSLSIIPPQYQKVKK